jgi:succinyl-CoA synthetase alpha subunit
MLGEKLEDDEDVICELHLGEKITTLLWDQGKYIQVVNGRIVDQDGHSAIVSLGGNYAYYEYYPDPTPCEKMFKWLKKVYQDGHSSNMVMIENAEAEYKKLVKE